MQGWNNCLPHKTEPLLPHPSTYSKSLPSLLNDTVKKPRNYPPPKSSIQVFPANKEEKKAFKSKIPNSQTNGYLFIYVYFFFVYSGKYIQKNNFSRTPREHLLACMETNFSDRHNTQFHSIPFYCIYVSRALIQTTMGRKVYFCRAEVRQQGKVHSRGQAPFANSELKQGELWHRQ